MCFDNISVIKIADALYVYSKKGNKDKTVNRYYYGLSFSTEGKITYIQNGIKTVSDSTNIILLPKGGCYEIIRQQNGYFPVINFESNKFITDKIESFPLSNSKLVTKLFFELKDCLFEDKHYEAISIFYKILSILFEPSSDNNTFKLNRYLQEHFDDPNLSNKQIASYLKISESYLNKLFYKYYDTSPKKYIIEKRMEYAKQLLTENTYNVSSICEKCGYSNVYSFSRAFKDYTNESPSVYKQKAKKQNL